MDLKRIDLHIHTLASPLDDSFSFEPEVLEEHVKHNKLDAVAITNHNRFDLQNYREACNAVPDGVVVFPGVEVNVKGFHTLVISSGRDIEVFNRACGELPETKQGDEGISIEEFKRLFGDSRYVVIPHYKKKPSIPSSDLEALGDIVTALEVSSEKKWEYEHRRTDTPVVLFSDFRCSLGSSPSWGRYTYVAMGEITFESLRLAFNDKSKFAITEHEDHFELEPNLYASTGLNVVIGGRSSGKTFFLNRIYNSCDPDDVVYIRQFSIVKDAEEDAFGKLLADEESTIKNEYYEPMNAISSAVTGLPTKDSVLKSIKDYLAELTEYADTAVRDDEFSKCPIYSESRLSVGNANAERKVVDAVITLLEDNPLSREIDETIGRENLIRLLRLAIDRFKEKALQCKRIERANEIAKKVRGNLTVESRRPGCPESPMLEAAKRAAYVKRLAKLRSETKSEVTVSEKKIGKFTRTTKRVPYRDARALKTALRASSSMSGFLRLPDTDFVESVLAADGVSDINHAFFDISVELKNDRGETVSGGQKAEYLFFKALDRAGNHDVVLIDEPESSFDNPFLNEQIALELKRISAKATVFIATHNNVLGVSIKPNGVVFTDVTDGVHTIYTCDSGDDTMSSADGQKMKRSEVLMRLMEAGSKAYEDRRPYYGLA